MSCCCNLLRTSGSPESVVETFERNGSVIQAASATQECANVHFLNVLGGCLRNQSALRQVFCEREHQR